MALPLGSSNNIIFILVIFLLLLNLFDSKLVLATILRNETDRLALLEFKSQISDDPHGILASWNESLQFCQWFGVKCGIRHQRIIALNLNNQKLVGTISPHVGNLSFLQYLNLGSNSFHGEIPLEVHHLFRLRDFNLSFNLLQGVIPGNFSRFSKLKNLALDQNRLHGQIPSELGSLLELMTLSLDRNNLTGSLPASIGNLSSLQVLSLQYNKLEGEIPYTFSNMRSLNAFQVGANNFQGVFPPALYNLSSSSLQVISLAMNNFSGNVRNDIGLLIPNLQKLALGMNQFNGHIPSSLSNASDLYYFDIGESNFIGSVPMNLGNLKNLQRLSVYDNLLHGSDGVNDLNFLTSLTNCSNLRHLDLSINRFRGTLPNSISNLSTQLTWFSFASNDISGTIPSGISNLIGLTVLDVYSNLLTGNIPASIGKLSNLHVCYLDTNQFTGEIPTSLGNITQMLDIRMEVNSLQGNIPSSLGNFKYLEALLLFENNLNGTIPKELMNLTSLSLYLDLSFNSLTGPLPIEIGNLGNINGLSVSNNKLSGEIPSTLENLVRLEDLYLDSNLFQGPVPLLNQLKSLTHLDLSSNNLSGQIPQYLVNFSYLLDLNLSYNNLEGEVPVQGVFSNASAIDVVGNLKLCGGIQDLHLHPCPMQNLKKHVALKLILLIVIPVLFFGLALAYASLYFMRKLKKKSEASSSPFGEFYPQISYQELLNATGGFSSSNLIGSGNFGAVYKGNLTPDETIIAVKVLKLHQKGASKSFMAECQALRNIRHRNLVKIITACSSTDFARNDFKALIYEFMPNGSLEDWLHAKVDQIQIRNLNLLQRIKIAIDVASALHYLHSQCEKSIIHCDLKPSNVLLDNDFTAHVSDFGLARLVSKSGIDEVMSQFSSVGVKGTTGYAPPEYGMGTVVSTQGDVYSFGILLLELFTGKRPTDETFKDDMNLHNLVKMALPERVMEVTDQVLYSHEIQEDQSSSGTSRWSECLISVLKIGVECSVESPDNRMDMRDVESGLVSIRDKFLGTRRLDHG